MAEPQKKPALVISASAYRSAYAICSSVHLFRFIDPSFPKVNSILISQLGSGTGFGDWVISKKVL